MLALAFYTAVLLPTVFSGSANESIYLVTVTSQAVSGSTETLCAQLHQPKEPVSFIITLETKGSNVTLLEESVKEDFYRCIPFQVPVVSVETVASVHVSVRGEKEALSKKTKFLIQPSSFIYFIQTDKPMYKPGQTVKFRIVSLDANFLPYNQVYTLVELQDPNYNRIGQWLNRSTTSGILDLSMRMSPDATQGTHMIKAWNEKGNPASHIFDIKEYVLPKYEVTVHLPSIITILDTQATMKVCGKYTYGKPVLGSVKAEVCRKPYRYYWYSRVGESPGICKTFSMTTDKTGCATEIIDVTQFALNASRFEDLLSVQSEMEEYGTGVILKGSESLRITDAIATVTFEETPQTYRPGIPFEGKIKATGPNSAPIKNDTVLLVIKYDGKSENWTFTTDDKGMAYFSLDTAPWLLRGVNLQAHYRKVEVDFEYGRNFRKPGYMSAQMWLRPFFSKSKSFLKLKTVSGKLSCDTDASIVADYIIQGEELEKEQKSLDFFYLVLSRGSLVQHGRLPVSVREGQVNKGDLSFSLRRMLDLAPFAQVVVYTVLPDGETVADSANFPIDLCLKNKVSVKFSSLQELPGLKTSLSLNAHPGSLCSLRAIDQSVRLMEEEQKLNEETVYSQLPVQKLSGYAYNVQDDEPYPCIDYIGVGPAVMEEEVLEEVAEDVLVENSTPSTLEIPTPPAKKLPEIEAVPDLPASKSKRSIIRYPGNDKDDVYKMFQDVGIKILTNSDVKKPTECHDIYYSDVVYADSVPMAFNRVEQDEVGSAARPSEPQQIVRTFFPETWIWDLVPVGDSGFVKVEKTVPDTITKWVAEAICTSPVGVGFSPTVDLIAFQPFFVSLTLPYSVIRGEAFTLKATVFNYLSNCIMVQLSLAESTEYTARPCEGCKYTHCLCGEESRTFNWIVTPTDLGEVSIKVSAEALKTDDLCENEVVTVPERGRIDTVIRTLLVEAEGTKEAISYNALLCPAEGPVEQAISVKLPEVFVEGSAKAYVSVLGDLLGRAMKNLDKLLAMPYGCGEQNMVLFAPNIYIMKYLKSTGQLTEEIKDRAVGFLENGYQRELRYKHDDGSYSAFGKSDESGNTWLTAFVLKSFGGARPYIYVDPEHIALTKTWLQRNQNPNGCFRSVGRLLHTGMKGGVSDEVSLTAYITAALLELDSNTTDPVVEKSLECLKAATGNMDHLYTTALLAYTFTLAGDAETRNALITHLHKVAITKGGSRYWKRAETSEERPDSLEVEMTSYVLLALLSGPSLPDFGLSYASTIVSWLTKQQNSYGGFSSTQDTVVALHALSLYGAAIFSPEGSSVVTVESAGGYSHTFKLDQDNRLLYQEKQLQEVPGEYTIKALGQGCVFAQIALNYNIPPPPDYSAFNISAIALGSCNSTEKKSLSVEVTVRYTGRREETNMVIINIKILSGFVLDKSSLHSLKRTGTVKRVDLEEGHVIIYLDQLKKGEYTKYSVIIEEDVPVRNLKPAVVKVYDYYQTSDEAVCDYSSPCAEGDEANEL
ncbi:hypothetical protein SKAU_G00082640 [Synaphobranchus kaupii]|uniref:Alpha-2-macroglobulin n=1 Tax=Synaphobranchus kaupii TaxID=118154 RepID=A0A9Q1J5N5_SYNKA|nr:hypothetical protein SKAU_G00082640 [Synaphobranchus kaupii]